MQPGVVVAAAETEPAEAGSALADAAVLDAASAMPMPPFEALRADPQAVALAEELFTRWQSVAGLERPHTMDGGYRGMIRIEPEAPVGAERKHLAWVVAAMNDFEAFFTALDAHAPTEARPHPARYRFAPVKVLFFRSMHARTPSAYAHDWTVAWNLAGSLNTSADAARETLFHEIFHLNDYAHPQGPYEAWSIAALSGVFEAVVRKCGTTTSCLAPYSPNDTVVRGGTYYSFQPGNGVREYAAELGLRYYREQRAELGIGKAGAKLGRFKCGPPENARAWSLVRDELFSGIDVVPPCATSGSAAAR